MEMTVDQALQKGIAAHNSGDLQEAEKFYRTILRVQPKHSHANHNLGLIAVSMHQPRVALPLFKNAIDGNPTIKQYWFSYIDLLTKEKQFKNAKYVIKKAKKAGFLGENLKALEIQLLRKIKGRSKKSSIGLKSPSEVEMKRLLANYQKGGYEEAEKLALSIIKEFPDHPFSYKVLGGIFKQMGRLSELVIVSEKVVELAPEEAESHNNLGITLKELDRLEDAEVSYRKAIALNLNYAEAHSNLGITLQELGRLEEAEASYNKAIKLKSDYAEVHYNLGITLQELGRLQEAETSYNKAIELKSDYVESFYNLGNMLQGMGRLEEAEVSYRQLIALNLKYVARAFNNLGITLQELGRVEEAEASFNKAIESKPEYSSAFINRAKLFFKLGSFEAALKDADFCNTKSSRLVALESLYALGRVEEVYQRIEVQSELGEEDIRVAAFASFL